MMMLLREMVSKDQIAIAIQIYSHTHTLNTTKELSLITNKEKIVLYLTVIVNVSVVTIFTTLHSMSFRYF